MQALANIFSCLALLGLGGGELVLILALVFAMFGAKRLPEIGRGLRLGWHEFRKQLGGMQDRIEGEATDAGKSVGGIYGKPAFEALTPKNQTTELYDPAAVRRDGGRGARPWVWLRRLGRLVWRWIGALLARRNRGACH